MESLQIRTGRKIKEARKLAGMTVEQAAENAEVTPMTWYRYEMGRHSFTTSTLEKIARALDCTVEVIIRPV